ncbi:hypothetical protein [Flavobacterium reichenbachii]|uniref:Uncharacterized protein n=1 Tax=Flavobacterium reichenbachii TaxID=362418 RepID=A0A085ZEP3_9FLAO|nr:hypothetical protein [Flavobacterium reichenbachii]KFF02907.1 hypothetical protein IW19_22375 [Flavobacterium reichenbachii]OXB16898.1 hypothetical protein B0A68_05560 [Flavobacterium reichenbachii]
MKKIVIAAFCFIILLSSCNDEESDAKITIPVGSITAKIDGVETSFNTEAYATLDTIPWSFGTDAVKLSIRGKKTSADNSENILIWFFVTPVRKIDAGTYPDLNKQIYHYIEFNNLWNGNLYNYGSNRYGDEFYTSKSTILRIDSLVQGVFSGNIGIGAGASGVEQPPLYHKITDGQFNVKIMN